MSSLGLSELETFLNLNHSVHDTCQGYLAKRWNVIGSIKREYRAIGSSKLSSVASNSIPRDRDSVPLGQNIICLGIEFKQAKSKSCNYRLIFTEPLCTVISSFGKVALNFGALMKLEQTVRGASLKGLKLSNHWHKHFQQLKEQNCVNS